MPVPPPTLEQPRTVNPFAGHSPDQPRPLGGYAVLLGVFVASATAFAGWFRRSGRTLPDTIAPGDLALLTVAGHKASRMITRDRVMSVVRAPFTRFQGDAGPAEVDEAARGGGLRLAIGELLVCPYCLSMWMCAALTASLLIFPRFTRWLCVVLVSFFGSELLQLAYSRAESLVSS
jgi:hypothetical protein